MNKKKSKNSQQRIIFKVNNRILRIIAVILLAFCCGCLNACNPNKLYTTSTVERSTITGSSTITESSTITGSSASTRSSTITGSSAITRSSASVLSSATVKPTNGKRPNIILILADDLGWTDGSTFGSAFFETPNLTRLRNESMYFTDAHACPLCSPTRASILTGQSSARTRLTTAIVVDPTRPEYVSTFPVMGIPGKTLPAWATASTIPLLTPETYNHLPLEHYTIAEALRDTGYSTGFFGKWHLGGSAFFPDKQGFQTSYATEGGGPPNGYFGGISEIIVPDSYSKSDINDKITDYSINFINTHKNDTNPFFLEVSEYYVHSPWQAINSRVTYYQNKLNDPAFKNDHPDNKHTNAIYAAMVEALDKGVGKILDVLDAPGNEALKENTVIVFSSDNGGEITKPGSQSTDPLYNITSNYPLRAHKHSIYEGGTRVPWLIRWPGKVKAGSTCDIPVDVVDFYPTFLEMAGQTPTKQWKSQVLDGTSVVPLLTKNSTFNREAIFTYHPHYMPIAGVMWSKPAVSIRKGDFKMIRFFEGITELYNLKNDIGENNNLAASNPAKVAELNVLLDKWLIDTNALIPVPNPAYKG